MRLLSEYFHTRLRGDLNAGLTVGVLLIPQGMAYASIAGLPPVYGLYTAIVPLLVYAVFGTSRQLAVGPVAMDSLLVASGVSALALAGTDRYVELALGLALLTGSFQFLFGLLRLGFLVHFLSRPVISGFTSAAAVIISLHQMPNLLGLPVERGSNAVMFFEILSGIPDVHMSTTFLGLATVALILLLKRHLPKVPAALIVVMAGILLVRFLELDAVGVEIVGAVPAGLPEFHLPNISVADAQLLLPAALSLALMGYLEAVSIAQSIRPPDEAPAGDGNHELIALGISNAVGAVFQSYAMTGSFSRSAVNAQSGARTKFAAVFSAAIVALVLLFFADWFHDLPQSVLAGIIVVAVSGLFDRELPVYLFRTNKEEFAMLALTFTITFVFGIVPGIGAGVLVSLLLLIRRTTSPHYAVLGRIPGTTDYRNVRRFDDLDTHPGILIFRYDAQLFFANIEHFLISLRKQLRQRPAVQLVVLHCGSIHSVDSTALSELRKLIADLHAQNVEVYFVALIGPVRDFFRRTGFFEEIGEDKFFLQPQQAVDAFGRGGFTGPRERDLILRASQSGVFRDF